MGHFYFNAPAFFQGTYVIKYYFMNLIVRLMSGMQRTYKSSALGIIVTCTVLSIVQV